MQLMHRIQARLVVLDKEYFAWYQKLLNFLQLLILEKVNQCY